MEVKLLSKETWVDFERLFERRRGVHASCWCMYHRMTMSEYIASRKADRKAAHRALVEGGAATGLLLYDGDEPIGWCQFGRATEFPAFDRMRDYVRLAIPDELRPVWRITCFVVDKNRRREGLSQVLLERTLAVLRGLGGGIVEAFVLEVPNVTKPQYTGSVRLYERFGFTEVAPIGTRHRLMRLALAGEDSA